MNRSDFIFHHEAGHAVVACVLGLRLVEVKACTDLTGESSVLPNRAADKHQGTRADVWRELYVTAGAGEAERIGLGTASPYAQTELLIATTGYELEGCLNGWRSFTVAEINNAPAPWWESAQRWSTLGWRRRRPQLVVCAAVRRAQAGAAFVLRKHWRAVEMLADLLRTQGTVSGDAVAGIVAAGKIAQTSPVHRRGNP